MPYSEVAKELKTLNETYLQKAFDYILNLKKEQNSAIRNPQKKSLQDKTDFFSACKKINFDSAEIQKFRNESMI